MSKESKINEGLALLNEKNNYQPLTQPMAETATRKVTQPNKSLLQEGHIDDMTAKWLSLLPNPPRIPIFYTHAHGQFNNSLSSPLPTNKYLDHLPSYYDLDLFTLNTFLDRSSNCNTYYSNTRCKYFSPHSFCDQKSKFATKGRNRNKNKQLD